jgi:hypothetical protein
MGKYDFVSVGAAGGNALEQFFIKRALEERQQMLDAQNRQKNAADIRQRDEQLRLQRDQEARQAEAQKAAQQNLEQEREFRRASTISENALPGDEYDAPTADILKRQGFGNQLKTLPGAPASLGFGVLEQAEQPAEGTGVLAQSPAPGILMPAQDERTVARGGSKYLAQRTAAEERAAQAEAARVAREEDAQRQREFVGTQNELNRQTTRAIAEGNQAIRRDLAQSKADEKAAASAKVDEAAANTRREVQVLIDNLSNHGSLNAVVGPIDSRTPTFLPGSVEAERMIGRLNSLLSLNERSKLKGQGQVSDFEGRMLADSASALSQATDEASFKRELARLRLTMDYLGDARSDAEKAKDARYASIVPQSPAAGGGPKRVVYDINGNPVQQ